MTQPGAASVEPLNPGDPAVSDVVAASPQTHWWSWALAVPLAGVLLYFSLRGVDWRTVWHTITGARWELLTFTSLFACVAYLLRSIRWRILLNAEANLSVGTVFCATLSGYLGNSFLPARAGELIRTMIISSRSSLSRTYVFTTALSERLMDVIALVLWSSLILLGVDSKPRWMEDVSRTMAAIAVTGAIVIAVLPYTGAFFRRILAALPLPAKLHAWLLQLLDQVLLGMRAFHNLGRFLGFAGMTVVIWLSDGCCLLVGARALGIHLSFKVAMLLLAALGLSSALPSTPGYVGIYQFVTVTVLAPFGVAKDAALAFILVSQALSYVVLLALGLPCVYVLRSKKAVKA